MITLFIHFFLLSTPSYHSLHYRELTSTLSYWTIYFWKYRYINKLLNKYFHVIAKEYLPNKSLSVINCF